MAEQLAGRPADAVWHLRHDLEGRIRSTIAATRGMLAPNGSVIWTRGYLTNEDLRPQIVRGLPKQDSQTDIAFDSEPAGYGVGVNRLLPHAPTVTTPDRLFSFVR